MCGVHTVKLKLVSNFIPMFLDTKHAQAQVCSRFSLDCGGLGRPVALVYSTLIGLFVYRNH